MAFYIPYIVGCTASAVIGKGLFSYLYINPKLEINNIHNENESNNNMNLDNDTEQPGNSVINNEIPVIIEHSDTNTEEKLWEKIACSKCKVYLSPKCFSKNQLKKNKINPRCKICVKLS